MDKVAFLLLTKKDFSRIDIWKRFFSSHDERWNLYVHSKEKSQFEWINENSIKYNTETSWAGFGLVKAQNLLLQEALLDKDNKVFVVISESHCPLYNLTKTIDKLLDKRGVFFSNEAESNERMEKRYLRSKYKKFSHIIDKKYFGFSSQWWVFDRKGAEFFGNESIKYDRLFKDTLFSDEHYYITMCNYKNIKYDLFSSTYANWKIPTDKNYSHLVDRPNPKTYFRVKDELIDALRNKGYIFMRKIHKISDINIKKILFE